MESTSTGRFDAATKPMSTYAICACGGRIVLEDGERIPCPHCGGTLTRDEVAAQAKDAEGKVAGAANKNPHGTMTGVCVDGLRRVSLLVEAARRYDAIALLDWRQVRKYVGDLVTDAAIEDGGMSEDGLKWD